MRTSKSPSTGIPKELAAKSHRLAADAPARQYRRTYTWRGVFDLTAGPAARSRHASDKLGDRGRYLHCRPRSLQSLNGTPAGAAQLSRTTAPSSFDCEQHRPAASTPHHSTLSPPPPLSANGWKNPTDPCKAYMPVLHLPCSTLTACCTQDYVCLPPEALEGFVAATPTGIALLYLWRLQMRKERSQRPPVIKR